MSFRDRPNETGRTRNVAWFAAAAAGALALALGAMHPGSVGRSTAAIPGLTAEESSHGIIVTSVRDGSDAQLAGIAPGDRIVSIDGRRFARLRPATNYIRHAPHQGVRIGLVHQARSRDVMIGRLEN